MIRRAELLERLARLLDGEVDPEVNAFVMSVAAIVPQAVLATFDEVPATFLGYHWQTCEPHVVLHGLSPRGPVSWSIDLADVAGRLRERPACHAPH